MIATTVHRARSITEVIAAALVAACGLRFAGASIAHALEHELPSKDESAAKAGSSRKNPTSNEWLRESLPRGAERLDPSAGTPHLNPSGVPSSNTAPASAVSMALVVTAGPPRSEVYVNGSFVGHSPFVGDAVCKAGRSVTIELMPLKGAPLRFERPCLPGTLRVEK
ncbi:MAG TPA: hypothetical protein VGJ84_19660 [Polyangiaceae bacterium]|jgi:hypothetical protein